MRSRHAEDDAVVVSATLLGGSVEIAIISLDKAAVGKFPVRAAKCIQRGERASGRHFEDGSLSGATDISSSIEVSVTGLNDPTVRVLAVGAIMLLAEGVKRSQGATGCDLEKRAGVLAVAGVRRTVEISVAGLNQRSERLFTITTVR